MDDKVFSNEQTMRYLDPNYFNDRNRKKTRIMRNSNTRFLMILCEQRLWVTFDDCCNIIGNALYINDLVNGHLALDICDSGAERPLTQQEKDDLYSVLEERKRNK